MLLIAHSFKKEYAIFSLIFFFGFQVIYYVYFEVL